jgi:hypothetical protein
MPLGFLRAAILPLGCKKPLLDYVANTRAERAVCSVFHPMHFIAKMAEHPACGSPARAAMPAELASIDRQDHEP